MTDQEYILIVSERVLKGELHDIGVVQCGLDKAQAEGVAFQLNEAFDHHGIDARIRAQTQTDIGRFHP
jgi:hypothetical protein